MELPAIKLPQIELPFSIEPLLHPPVDHFVIALPVIVLLLEVVNIFTKKRAIGVVSFFLLILTVLAAIAAYFTGTVDGKAAWDVLGEAAQGELKEHKLLGTYLMFASMAVLIFKVLSVAINRGLMKGLYILVLILFTVGILNQGKEGGELVYKYGVHVEKVKELDSEVFDLNDTMQDLEEEIKELEEELQEIKKNKENEADVVAPAPLIESIQIEAKDSATVVEEKIKDIVTTVEEVISEVAPQEEKPQVATH